MTSPAPRPGTPAEPLRDEAWSAFQDTLLLGGSRDIARAAFDGGWAARDGLTQDEVYAALDAAFGEYGLTGRQRAGIEGACAQLIEAAAHPPYKTRRERQQKQEAS